MRKWIFVLVLMLGCKPSTTGPITPLPLEPPPRPITVVDEAADKWRIGVKRVFRESADWVDQNDINDVGSADHLREEMVKMTLEITTPLMVVLNQSVVPDAEGNPHWDRKKFVELLKTLGE